MSVHQLLWYRLTPPLLLHRCLQLWRLQNTEDDVSDPEPADEAHIQMEYLSV